MFELVVAFALIGHQMAIIDVQIYKNIIHDILLNRGSRVNIIIEKLKACLGLLKPQLAPYNLWMIDQMFTKLLQFIRDIQILVHGIPYNMLLCIIMY